MKKKLIITALAFLVLAGCGAKMPNGSEVSSQSELSTVVSQSHHDEVSVQFMNSMGCADKNCTDASHYHHCPADCTDYDHYHNCSLDCSEASHHHSGHTAESSHKEHRSEGDHGDSHHK